MSGKFYQPQKRNRSPDQRRQYRKQVEVAPVSETVETQPLATFDTTDRSVRGEMGEYPSETVGGVHTEAGFFVGGGGWRLIAEIGALLVVIVGAIIFFSNLSSKTTENTVNIENLRTSITQQDTRAENNYNRAIEYVDKQISNLRSDIKDLLQENRK